MVVLIEDLLSFLIRECPFTIGFSSIALSNHCSEPSIYMQYCCSCFSSSVLTVLVLSVLLATQTADVTCLAVSADQKCLFASGFDHKIVQLTRLQSLQSVQPISATTSDATTATANSDATTAGANSEEHTYGMLNAYSEDEDLEPTDGEWVYTCSQRPHTHDIRTLGKFLL